MSQLGESVTLQLRILVEGAFPLRITVQESILKVQWPPLSGDPPRFFFSSAGTVQ